MDDKALTKQICDAHGIRVPETYAIIERFGDIRRFSALLGDRQEFVVKPARGAGGRGVLVIARQNGTEFETSSGEVLSLSEVQYHVSTTLSGLYSLGGRPDKAIVERRIERDPLFDRLAVGEGIVKIKGRIPPCHVKFPLVEVKKGVVTDDELGLGGSNA